MLVLPKPPNPVVAAGAAAPNVEVVAAGVPNDDPKPVGLAATRPPPPKALGWAVVAPNPNPLAAGAGVAPKPPGAAPPAPLLLRPSL